MFVVEGTWEDGWLPVGVYSHAGAALATAKGLALGRELTPPAEEGDVVWSE